jgi:hypothetical protein
MATYSSSFTAPPTILASSESMDNDIDCIGDEGRKKSDGEVKKEQLSND